MTENDHSSSLIVKGLREYRMRILNRWQTEIDRKGKFRMFLRSKQDEPQLEDLLDKILNFVSHGTLPEPPDPPSSTAFVSVRSELDKLLMGERILAETLKELLYLPAEDWVKIRFKLHHAVHEILRQRLTYFCKSCRFMFNEELEKSQQIECDLKKQLDSM